MTDREQLILALGLEAHVEGGFFRQTYKAENGLLINTDNGERTTMTSIFYLLTSDAPIGHFHLNKSDIVHYFHTGDPIDYYLIDEEGELSHHVMGPDVVNGQKLQLVVKGGTWKASNLSQRGSFGYGLIGEAVAPGFEYKDMTLAQREIMCEHFPQHQELIRKLTHPQVY